MATLLISSISYADNTFLSQGRIEYGEGASKVVFDAKDLVAMQAEIDALKAQLDTLGPDALIATKNECIAAIQAEKTSDLAELAGKHTEYDSDLNAKYTTYSTSYTSNKTELANLQNTYKTELLQAYNTHNGNLATIYTGYKDDLAADYTRYNSALAAQTQKSYVGMVICSSTMSTMQDVIDYYGGTKWVQIKDRFLIGAGGSYAANSTGGAVAHTLTVNEMPSHDHGKITVKEASASSSSSSSSSNMYYLIEYVTTCNASARPHTWRPSDVNNLTIEPEGADGYSPNNLYLVAGSVGSGNISTTNSDKQTSKAGGGSSFSVLNPYQAVYIWQRTQ